jgi:hypothetical protein
LLICALTFATACGGDDEPPPAASTEATTATSPSGSPPLASATRPPNATAAALPTPLAVTRTEVITYSPPASAPSSATGVCFGLSVRVARLGAWSCSIGNEIRDPCFGDPTATSVICIRNPWEPDTLVQINLLDPACTTQVGTDLCAVAELPPSTSGEPRPWAFETAQGTLCGLQRGTLGQYQGQIVPYGCEDAATIVGYPTAGTVWTVRVVDNGSGAIETVPLVRVWQ